MKQLLLLIGCLWLQGLSAMPTDTTYEAAINAWQAQREAALVSEAGWLNLAGLFALKPGRNTFGSAPDNALVFPKGEAHIGAFILENGQVRVEIAPAAEVWQDAKPVNRAIIFRSKAETPVVLQHQSLRWFVIQRGERFLVRLRDLEHPAVQQFNGIERFPSDTTWRVEATLEPAAPDFQLRVADVIGTVSMQASPGAFLFEKNGQPHRLYPTVAGDELFFVFADETNGDSTYGAGRFLYAPLPDAQGKTVLDFNKAYNPPCAFTAWATCPLPSPENYLKLSITAGEKTWGEH
ncbi:MAG TPA: DUF1684 domain-containing protein [Saprospiraceae bacterium]|nr:DUF1684 domain-containing protein [Saprospiraceae bacterium]HMP25485.1 DUF1684 domain-containing protein [Saprospiraceae bacterium]